MAPPRPQVVSALLSLGLSPNVVNKEGDTPLHLAARGGHIEVGGGSAGGGRCGAFGGMWWRGKPGMGTVAGGGRPHAFGGQWLDAWPLRHTRPDTVSYTGRASARNTHTYIYAHTSAVARGPGFVGVQACRALVAGGADLLRRNNKNRTPKTQVWRQWRAGRGDSGAAAVLVGGSLACAGHCQQS